MSSQMALVPKKSLINHGREIFAYNNIGTNQVVYSLDRVLNNNDAIKQLTYAGKGTVPTKLRKDMWKPLWMVSFPSTSQGLAAYRMLREWRRLHELSWNPEDINGTREFPSEDLRVREEKRVEKIQQMGGARKGGPRGKERVFNLGMRLSRRTHHQAEKRKIIQNQRANSIADLAAVLLHLDNMRVKSERDRKDKEKQYKEMLWTEVERLYIELTEQDGLAKVEAEIAAAENNKQSLAASPYEDPSRRKQRGALKREIRQLRERRDKLSAINAILNGIKLEGGTDVDQVVKKVQDEAAAAGKEATGEQIVEARKSAVADQKTALRLNIPSLASLPLFAEAHKLYKQVIGPERFAYTSEGVRVRWANSTDADYAESWPLAVKHDELGLVRHTMPKPEEPAMLSMEDKHVYNEDGQTRTELDEPEAWQYFSDQRREFEFAGPGESPASEFEDAYVESKKHRLTREMNERSEERRQLREQEAEQLAAEHQAFLRNESEKSRTKRETAQDNAVKKLSFKQKIDEETVEAARYEVFNKYFEHWRRFKAIKQRNYELFLGHEARRAAVKQDQPKEQEEGEEKELAQ